ncbi:MAG TPA: CoA-binding protein [Bauldia sp.]|nr:CoA-binding protein [Bauldia sp.]
MNHDRYDDGYIRAILADVKSVAVVGASVNPARASNIVVKYLLGKKYRVYPVNPVYAGQKILGQLCYASLADLPEPVDAVDIFRRPDAVPALVEEALALKPRPKVIWMQLAIRDDAVAARAEAEGVKVVMNRCMKIEYGRLSGEISWFGVNTQVVSSRRPVLADLPQNLDLGEGN